MPPLPETLRARLGDASLKGAHACVRLRELAHVRFKDLKNGLAATEARLRLLGPEQVLSRGYSITMDAGTGRVLREAAKIKAGQTLRTRLSVGEVLSQTAK